MPDHSTPTARTAHRGFRRTIRSISLLVALTLAAVVAPVASPSTAAAATPVPSETLGIRYVVVLVLENRSYSDIVGSTNAPYLNSLIARYGLATNFTGVAHPSQPNYLALLGGSTFGVRDDGVHNISATNLIDQLEAKHLTWHVAAENVPGRCFVGGTAYGGADGPGWYARKHEPAISFNDIRGNPTRCAKIGNLASFRPGGANVQLVIPNSCHDMHDCSTATGDSFLRQWLPRILDSPTFAETLLVITTDEGSDSAGGGGHIATLVISPSVRPHTRGASRMNHYAIVRTIENLWGLPCLRNACTARDLLPFLHPR